MVDIWLTPFPLLVNVVYGCSHTSKHTMFLKLGGGVRLISCIWKTWAIPNKDLSKNHSKYLEISFKKYVLKNRHKNCQKIYQNNLSKKYVKNLSKNLFKNMSKILLESLKNLIRVYQAKKNPQKIGKIPWKVVKYTEKRLSKKPLFRSRNTRFARSKNNSNSIAETDTQITKHENS